MKLKCQLPDAKCPPYQHEGDFVADDATLHRLSPDMKRCAGCMAFHPPRCPDFRDDLEQSAAMVLIEKGSTYDPFHKSRASFGTFIRPRICLHLMNAKNREVEHRDRMGLVSVPEDAFSKAEDDSLPGTSVIETYPDPGAERFTEEVVDAALREDFFAALPQLLTCLTRCERKVFQHLRTDASSNAIAAALKLSKGRVSQLRKQVIQKLTKACRKRGWRSESI